jgi:hypothetical protein
MFDWALDVEDRRMDTQPVQASMQLPHSTELIVSKVTESRVVRKELTERC